MTYFPPNLDPKIYNLSAMVIGFSLIGNFSAAEQNAIGNWFITLGQILENNSAWQGLVEDRIKGGININSQEAKQGGNPYFKGMPSFESNVQKDIENIKKTLELIIDELKKMQ